VKEKRNKQMKTKTEVDFELKRKIRTHAWKMKGVIVKNNNLM
jgi:hypothetical protein